MSTSSTRFRRMTKKTTTSSRDSPRTTVPPLETLSGIHLPPPHLASPACRGPCRPRRLGAGLDHLELPFEEGALMHDEGSSVDLARHPPARLDLHPPVAVELAVDLAGDHDARPGHLRVDLGLLLDEDRPLALKLALHGAPNPDGALGAQVPLEGALLADDALDVIAQVARDRPLGGARNRQVHVLHGRPR